MKNLVIVVLLLFLTGCATVKYNGVESIVKKVDYPELGKTVTVYVGDYLIQKGVITEQNVLVVHQTIDGALYDIPARNYFPIGADDKDDFFSATGVVRGPFADPIQALSLGKKNDSKLCVITTFGGKACYEGEYERQKKDSRKERASTNSDIQR